MKKEIHPEYHPESEVKCSCGASFNVGSTMPKIEVEICSSCHPFFTGVKKMIDTGGRVEKFRQRTEAAAKAPKKTVKKVAKATKDTKTTKAVKAKKEVKK